MADFFKMLMKISLAYNLAWLSVLVSLWAVNEVHQCWIIVDRFSYQTCSIPLAEDVFYYIKEEG